jgi:hypothetical protein
VEENNRVAKMSVSLWVVHVIHFTVTPSMKTARFPD